MMRQGERMTTYVVCHLAHELARDFVKDSLQICLTVTITCGLEIVNALFEVLWQRHIGEDLQILGVEETQACFALHPP